MPRTQLYASPSAGASPAVWCGCTRTPHPSAASMPSARSLGAGTTPMYNPDVQPDWYCRTTPHPVRIQHRPPPCVSHMCPSNYPSTTDACPRTGGSVPSHPGRSARPPLPRRFLGETPRRTTMLERMRTRGRSDGAANATLRVRRCFYGDPQTMTTPRSGDVGGWRARVGASFTHLS